MIQIEVILKIRMSSILNKIYVQCQNPTKNHVISLGMCYKLASVTCDHIMLN